MRGLLNTHEYEEARLEQEVIANSTSNVGYLHIDIVTVIQSPSEDEPRFYLMSKKGYFCVAGEG